MADIPRSADDIVIDRMKSELDAFSLTQTIANRFATERDMTRPPPMRLMPINNIWLDSLNSMREGSTAKLNQQESARIYVDMYTAGKDANEDGYDEIAAIARLYYLKEQVKYGLYKLLNADFGFSPGIIARKKWPQYTYMPGDLMLPEREVVAGRWTIEFEYLWTPEDITGTALDEIAVNAGLWSGLYEYEEA